MKSETEPLLTEFNRKYPGRLQKQTQKLLETCRQQLFTLTMCLPVCLLGQLARTPFNCMITARTQLGHDRTRNNLKNRNSLNFFWALDKTQIRHDLLPLLSRILCSSLLFVDYLFLVCFQERVEFPSRVALR